MRGVLFDLDGVLIHSGEAWFFLLRSLAEQLGYPEVQRDAFYASFGQGVQADIAEFFPDETPQGLGALYDRHFMEHVAHVAVAPGASEVMQMLRARGLGVAVVTNTPRPLAVSILESLGLEADFVFGPDETLEEKPSPAMLFAACSSLKIKTSEAVMVGDSRYDRGAARAAGARFVGVGIEGDAQITALSELPEALGL